MPRRPRKGRIRQRGAEYEIPGQNRLLRIRFEEGVRSKHSGKPGSEILYTMNSIEKGTQPHREREVIPWSGFQDINHREIVAYQTAWKKAPKEIDLKEIDSVEKLRAKIKSKNIEVVNGVFDPTDTNVLMSVRISVPSNTPGGPFNYPAFLSYNRDPATGKHRLVKVDAGGGHDLYINEEINRLITKAQRRAPKDIKGVFGQIPFRLRRRFGKGNK